eukprot:GHUV01006689.1.p1 GENE.GHUV01006689.1~~GHUV01006689.1.p1  ORF type:complete len:528 (+),score=242.14 GHUV01006689.1:123-1706(+)
MKETDESDTKRLPQRSTRGKRLRAQLDDEQEADAEFWNQEFFAEDAADADYVSEKEEEDVIDSDFYESESEEDDEEVEVRKEPKKKALKAPGAPPTRPKPSKTAAHRPPKPPASSSEAAAAELSQALLFEATYEAPTLRKSTQKRMEEAKREREQREHMAKLAARPKKQGDNYVMTQEELLAEAARTELENLASLKQLVAQEEETKRKANIKKQRFGGPMIKMRSRAVEVLVPPAAPTHGQQEQQQAHMFSTPAAARLGTPAGGNTPAAAASTVTMPVLLHSTPPLTPISSISAVAAADPAAAALQPQDAAAAAVLSAAAAPGSDAVTGEATPAAGAQSAEAQQQQHQQEQQQQQQPESQPAGPTMVKQAVTTLQCCGMRPPKWLQPQRARPPPGKPLCAITGVVARYRDPMTGYPYATVAAFRELRRRLGQPVPEPQPKAVEDLDLQPAAAAGVAGQQGLAAAAADAYPCGQQQLLQLLAHQVQQQQAIAAANKAVKGRGNNSLLYQQPTVPDEVAALVVSLAPGY